MLLDVGDEFRSLAALHLGKKFHKPTTEETTWVLSAQEHGGADEVPIHCRKSSLIVLPTSIIGQLGDQLASSPGGKDVLWGVTPCRQILTFEGRYCLKLFLQDAGI